MRQLLRPCLRRAAYLQKAGAAVVAAGVAGSGAAVLCEDALHTVRFPFSHNGNLSAYDHAS